MAGNSEAKQAVFQRTLEHDLIAAERFLHLMDLLFQPPRSHPDVIHPYQQGLFIWLEQAATIATLVSLRRCLDSHWRSMGLVALAKDGLISEQALPAALLEKITTMIDQAVVHSDAESFTEGWWLQNGPKRGELRSMVQAVRESIDSIRLAKGLDRVHTPIDEMDGGMDKLLDDIHLAASVKQLQDRARSNLSVSPEALLRETRPPRTEV